MNTLSSSKETLFSQWFNSICTECNVLDPMIKEGIWNEFLRFKTANTPYLELVVFMKQRGLNKKALDQLLRLYQYLLDTNENSLEKDYKAVLGPNKLNSLNSIFSEVNQQNRLEEEEQKGGSPNGLLVFIGIIIFLIVLAFVYHAIIDGFTQEQTVTFVAVLGGIATIGAVVKGIKEK